MPSTKLGVGSASPFTRFSVIGACAGASVVRHNLGAVADVIASPGDLTISNSGNLADFSIASSLMSIDHDTTQDAMHAGFTCPRMVWTIPRTGGAVGIEMHTEYPNSASIASQEYGGPLVMTAGATTQNAHALIGLNGANQVYNATITANSNDPAEKVLTAGEILGGLWSRIIVEPSGDVKFYYYISADHTVLPEESDWTMQRFADSTFSDSATIDVGFFVLAATATAVGIQMDVNVVHLLMPTRTRYV